MVGAKLGRSANLPKRRIVRIDRDIGCKRSLLARNGGGRLFGADRPEGLRHFDILQVGQVGLLGSKERAVLGPKRLKLTPLIGKDAVSFLAGVRANPDHFIDARLQRRGHGLIDAAADAVELLLNAACRSANVGAKLLKLTADSREVGRDAY